MESLNTDFVFQTDSTLVQAMYEKDNYCISMNPDATEKNICVLYFSSHDIYYPNREDVFRKKIVEKDSYEWYGTRIEAAYKHIFIRDIQKQWYIKGINKRINSPEKLLDFLKKECEGYRIITVGSSAGGYAAVLYGSQLGAEKVFSFNGQFELNSLLVRSTSLIDPLLFRLQNTDKRIYFDLKPFLNRCVPIYYFVSLGSSWDREQFEHIETAGQIKSIQFRTSHHGIPFPKACLYEILNSQINQLERFEGSLNRPLIFSFQMIGFFSTCLGITNQIIKRLKRSI